MCTAISYTAASHYFARNLDLEYSLGESVLFTPRNFPLSFRRCGTVKNHYTILGAGVIRDRTPLYYDGFNEKGLCMAGLAFPEFAHYPQPGEGSVAPFELIPWVLGQCATVQEAESLLRSTHVGALAFSPELPLTPMHWLIADNRDCLVLEPRETGLEILRNPTKVLTNAPDFLWHQNNLRQYLHLSTAQPDNTLVPELELSLCSRGTGAVGLPGDLSSPSRFLRAAFALHHSRQDPEPLTQCFHILETVSQTRGLVELENGQEFTHYTGCCCPDQGQYIYTTYENRQLTAVDAGRLDPEGKELSAFPMLRRQNIHLQN